MFEGQKEFESCYAANNLRTLQYEYEQQPASLKQEMIQRSQSMMKKLKQVLLGRVLSGMCKERVHIFVPKRPTVPTHVLRSAR